MFCQCNITIVSHMTTSLHTVLRIRMPLEVILFPSFLRNCSLEALLLQHNAIHVVKAVQLLHGK